MALLAAVNYDPAVVQSHQLSPLAKMRALDTTNLRLTFDAPESGNVLVRMVGCFWGSTVVPSILLGVMEGTTIVARSPVQAPGYSSNSNTLMRMEVSIAIPGLVPGSTHTWDAAFSIEMSAGSGYIKYGGPNGAATSDDYGAFSFEVWEA